MAINSVGSSTSADALTVGAKVPPERSKLAAPGRNDGGVFRGRQETAISPDKEVESPKPVVNTQGQTTGRIINTSA